VIIQAKTPNIIRFCRETLKNFFSAVELDSANTITIRQTSLFLYVLEIRLQQRKNPLQTIMKPLCPRSI